MNELNVELPPEIPVEEARLVLAAKLFELGRLSLGQAARMAGYSRPTFMELLGRLGVPVFNYPAEDLERRCSFESVQQVDCFPSLRKVKASSGVGSLLRPFTIKWSTKFSASKR